MIQITTIRKENFYTKEPVNGFGSITSHLKGGCDNCAQRIGLAAVGGIKARPPGSKLNKSLIEKQPPTAVTEATNCGKPTVGGSCR